jgi:hypothetical protein
MLIDMSFDAVLEWILLADFYVWPHITTFDSLEDLIFNLTSTNLNEISLRMRIKNDRDRLEIMKQWEDILTTVQMGKNSRRSTQAPVQIEVTGPVGQNNKIDAANNALNYNYGVRLAADCAKFEEAI